MTGYIILTVLFILAAVFFAGWSCGAKRTEAKFEKAQRTKEQAEKSYREKNVAAKQEAYNEAEKRKAGLSGGSSDSERFDNINDSLRNNS